MFKINFLVLVILFMINASAQKGKVYLVPGSDTSINPYFLNQYDNMLWAAKLYADPSMYGHTVMDSSFRNKYRDSYGSPLKMTWWMMGGNVFTLSRNCNVPVRTNYTLYLMKKYFFKEIEQFSDHFSLHYHNYIWSDPNGDGVYHWNQGMDFLLSKDDYEQTLCKYLIENDVFPVSFRSGWHFMDNAWQSYQEKFIPFDMSNAYPANGGSLVEPSWWIDWSQSPSAFVPYHPNADNYQIEGKLKQWRLRSLYFQDEALIRKNLEIMFKEAAAGKNQMVCVWGHLAENGFLDGVSNLDAIAHQFSTQYGVEFKYCTDTEAMRLWINLADTVAPVLNVNEITEGDKIRFAIKTDGPIFQADEPFIAIKTIYEKYERLSCSLKGENYWVTNDAVPKSILAKVAVAVCDSVGNQTKKHINYVPDDIFVDDQQREFQEISGNWQDYTNGELWDLKARIVHGIGAVAITPYIEESRAYRISFHGPGSNSNSVRCIIRHASKTDTLLFSTTLLGSDHWQQIGIYYLEKGTGNTLTIENLNSEKDLGLDVFRFTPLIPKKYIIIDRDSLNFGSVSIRNTAIQYITIINMGSETLNISSITKSGNNIKVGADFPMALTSMEKRKIPIMFFTQELGEYNDTLTIQSNDLLNPVIHIPVHLNALPYFKLVDNDDPTGYKEFGNQWFTSGATAYGPSSRCSWIQGNGLQADFTMTLKYDAIYDVQYIVPKTANAHDHADYIIFVDGKPIDTVVVNQNIGSGQFVSIGKYYLPKDVPIILRIQDNGGNTNPGSNIVLRADAVRFVRIESTVGVKEDPGVPGEFKVLQNYPNPFNPITHIRYSLPSHADVRLIIYDITGRIIKEYNYRSQKSGMHEIVWDGTNLLEQKVSSGIYFYQLHAGDFIWTRKMVYMR